MHRDMDILLAFKGFCRAYFTGVCSAGFIYDETFQKYEMSVIMFTNKNSGKNLRDKRRIYHLRKLIGDDGQVFATTSVEHLEELVADLYDDMNPSKVIIDGGDSTYLHWVEKDTGTGIPWQGAACFRIDTWRNMEPAFKVVQG